MEFKSGFVTIIGRPNVGKSTLLNKLVGEKIAIMSNKPQTTRHSIKAIINIFDSQIVFIDTPGIHKPKNKLGEYMINLAKEALNEVDVILFLIEADNQKCGPGDLYIIEQLKKVNTPVFLIINKIDIIKKESLLFLINEFKELMNFECIIPISAIDGTGLDIIINEIKKILPEGPKFFPDDQITDQSERTIVSEIIREKILNLIEDEIPHGIGVEITKFKKRKNQNIIDITGVIYCEKESHKGIIIGKQGKMLKQIGINSRIEIENFLKSKIFIELWVKVKPDWRNSQNMLKMLGYKTP